MAGASGIESWDVVVAGGGLAGLAAAAAFGAAGFRTLAVDPAPPVTEPGAPGADLRTTAILAPSVALLEEAGLWPALAPHATALEVMRIVETRPGEARPRVVRDFAAPPGAGPLAWNLPNWLMRREMAARLAAQPGVAFRPGAGGQSLLARSSEARITLADGSRHRAALVIAADGRDSPLRRALGIGVAVRRRGQKALAFAVTHESPHGNVSTEVHCAGGPFTLVPLPDIGGRPASSVVWMEPAAEALRLAALPEADFEAAATARSAGLLGALRLASPRQVWPIIAQIANRMAGERVALVAEAAHVVPPIGAQGLNMALTDIAVLLGLARADREGLGGAAMLASYHRRRHPEAAARVAGVDLLNLASMAGATPLAALREAGLTAIHDIAPLRRMAMRAGMGGAGRVGRGAGA